MPCIFFNGCSWLSGIASFHVLVSPVCDLRLVTPVSSRSRLIHGVSIHSFIHSYIRSDVHCIPVGCMSCSRLASSLVVREWAHWITMEPLASEAGSAPSCQTAAREATAARSASNTSTSAPGHARSPLPARPCPSSSPAAPCPGPCSRHTFCIAFQTCKIYSPSPCTNCNLERACTASQDRSCSPATRSCATGCKNGRQGLRAPVKHPSAAPLQERGACPARRYLRPPPAPAAPAAAAAPPSAAALPPVTR